MADRSSKRSAAQERLRGGFLLQLAPELHQLAELSEEGDDARDSIVAELSRLANTAGALGMNVLSEVCEAAAARVDAGDELPGVLVPVARAIRRARPTPQFGPIGILGDQALATAFDGIRPTSAEPLVAVKELDALARPLSPSPWAVILVPANQVEQAFELADGAPVVGWGDPNDWSARQAAAVAGAAGYVVRDDPRSMLDQLRSHTDPKRSAPEICVIAPADERLDALLDALDARGFGTVSVSSARAVGPALDVVCPDAVVIAGGIGVDMPTLVRACRGHGSLAVAPILVVADEQDESEVRRAGADDVAPVDIGPAVLSQRIADRVARARAIRTGRWPNSGAPDRPSTLWSLDDLLGHVVRTEDVVTVAILEVVGFEKTRERWGRAAVNAAQRHAASVFSEQTRRIDLVGQLSESMFLVALHDCPERIGRRRLNNLAAKLELRLHADHHLRELMILFGCADTERGPEGVVVRAEADLLAIRSSTR